MKPFQKSLFVAPALQFPAARVLFGQERLRMWAKLAMSLPLKARILRNRWLINHRFILFSEGQEVAGAESPKALNSQGNG
ncbi:MAG: hypothetical protein WBA92_12295 [Pseudorhodobacter sp.]